MTNEELAKAIEDIDLPKLDEPWREYADGHGDGFDAGCRAAAALVRANAPRLRPASEAAVGEDVMIVKEDGDIFKANVRDGSRYESRYFDRIQRNSIETWGSRHIVGWFPVPEFAKVNP